MLNRQRMHIIAGAVLVTALQGAGFATADATADDAAASASQNPLQAATGNSNSLDAAAALDDEALTRQRGGTLVVNDMKLDGVVSDNQAYNLNTGNNIISNGAFSGASGMPMVIQNSGNNVLIQNATIVNVQVQ